MITKKSLDVTVVIVNWNTRDLLNQTLKSLYEKTRGVTFETIIVDNASRDGSIEMLHRLWRQIKLIRLSKNIGFGAANNKGFIKAKGRFVLVLNSDTVVNKTTLPVMVKFLDEQPGAGCVGCKHFNLDKTLQRSMEDIFHSKSESYSHRWAVYKTNI